MADHEIDGVALLRELQSALGAVVDLLKGEGLAFTFPTYRYALEMVNEALTRGPTDLMQDPNARRLLKRHIQGPYGGTVGSFSDLTLERGDEGETLEVNRVFNHLRDRLYVMADQL